MNALFSSSNWNLVWYFGSVHPVQYLLAFFLSMYVVDACLYLCCSYVRTFYSLHTLLSSTFGCWCCFSHRSFRCCRTLNAFIHMLEWNLNDMHMRWRIRMEEIASHKERSIIALWHFIVIFFSFIQFVFVNVSLLCCIVTYRIECVCVSVEPTRIQVYSYAFQSK